MQIILRGAENFFRERDRMNGMKRNVLRVVPRVVKKHAFVAKRKVKTDMPRDTGRARASWGEPFPSNFNSEPGDGIWEVKDNGWTIEQGFNVEYVPALNAGTSMQAPAGFIDAIKEEVQEDFADELAEVMAGLFQSDRQIMVGD